MHVLHVTQPHAASSRTMYFMLRNLMRQTAGKCVACYVALCYMLPTTELVESQLARAAMQHVECCQTNASVQLRHNVCK